MKKIFSIVLLSVLTLGVFGCAEDNDDVRVPAGNLEINDFVWKAMNIFYFYKGQVPNLSVDDFSGNEDYTNFLNSFETPEELFDAITIATDRFSIIVEDYRVLEASFQGSSIANGMRFGLVRITGTDQVFGVVRYVVPNSSAELQGVERGMIFTQVDGVQITESNFAELLDPATYTIGLAELVDNALVANGQSITMTKSELSENPIHISSIIDVNGQSVGYLMYNNFRSNFESELNQVFANFKNNAISDLVLDLRYNSGGSVATANDLASMITGQFEGQVFGIQVFNENFEDVIINFDNQTADGEQVNSLNLDRVFVLTTGSTASASELIINALNPYIDVIHIGTETTGKFQGSTTLYDSEDFTRQNVNINHFYALQPLILTIANAEGFTGFEDGLPPDIVFEEDFFNYGVLGNPSEPLLARALQEIGSGLIGGDQNQDTDYKSKTTLRFSLIDESGSKSPDYQRMYVDIK